MHSLNQLQTDFLIYYSRKAGGVGGGGRYPLFIRYIYPQIILNKINYKTMNFNLDLKKMSIKVEHYLVYFYHYLQVTENAT